MNRDIKDRSPPPDQRYQRPQLSSTEHLEEEQKNMEIQNVDILSVHAYQQSTEASLHGRSSNYEGQSEITVSYF